MMRKLYWKIFFSFWIATVLAIMAMAWGTNKIADRSALPIREKILVTSYANAAVAAFESGKYVMLRSWLDHIEISRHMRLYLIDSKGNIFGKIPFPKQVYEIKDLNVANQLADNISKMNDTLISAEIISSSGEKFRLVAIVMPQIGRLLHTPLSKELTIGILFTIIISGLICYFLSLYLTKPIRVLRNATKELAKGEFGTRVGHKLGIRKDEMAELGGEFDNMAAQLEQLVNLKQRLIQDISHELRSPLARLQVALEIARGKTNNIAQEEFERIELEIIRLNELIGEIFSLATMNKSNLELEKSPVDLIELINGIINDANYEFSSNILRVILTEYKPIEINVDKKLIHRAVENIIRNALNYTPINKTVEVSVKTHGDNLKIIISDQGNGVPTEELDKIFNPFYRVDASRNIVSGGHGLGLAIAKQAVQLHDGTINAKNQKSGGLTIEILLPLNNEKEHDT